MPWPRGEKALLRSEFVSFAQFPTTTFRDLCQRFGIRRKTGYKWLARAQADPAAPLVDRSRQPHHWPFRTSVGIEQAVLRVRDANPAWGGRKIQRVLRNRGYATVPVPSTITAVLRRHDRLSSAVTAARHRWQRFEEPAPNELWQMDFKGPFTICQSLCHPLTVLDDHSRFALCLQACAHQEGATVQAALTTVFRRYGLPQRMCMDNGVPWGTGSPLALTHLSVWLIRLGITVSHSRFCHPQTQGKDERFHRTLEVELLRGHPFRSLAHCQRAFDRWRYKYNHDRPHDALALEVPLARYQPSPRRFPTALPAIEYSPDDQVRKVQDKGEISFQGRVLRLSRALRGQPVGLRPTARDGCFEVYFCHQKLMELDFRAARS